MVEFGEFINSSSSDKHEYLDLFLYVTECVSSHVFDDDVVLSTALVNLGKYLNRKVLEEFYEKKDS